MQSLDNQKLVLIDALSVAIGIILLLLSGNFKNEYATLLSKALGVSFVTSGFVSFMVHKFHNTQNCNTVTIVADDRLVLSNEYRNLKYAAKEVDIVGIAMSNALEELASDDADRLLRRVLTEGCKVRIIFLSPTSSYVNQRATEDNVSEEELRGILKRSVQHCEKIYEKLNRLYESVPRNAATTGSLEIRVMDVCPHATIYRTDDKILWGIYTSIEKGIHSPVFDINKKLHVLLFGQLTRHFQKIWDMPCGDIKANDHYLIRYYDCGTKPIKNRALFDRLRAT